MPKRDDEPELVDASDLTDVDWAEINKLKEAFAKDGREGFERAFDELYERDDIHWMRIAYAYYPTTVTEALKDNVAEAGLTAEDLRELIWKLQDEPVPTKH
jgi:hypothetical protein